MKRSFLYSLVCMLLLGVTACVDDEIRPFDDIPEGETTVSAMVEFNPLMPALETRAVAGDAIKSIKSLCVLVYGLDGNLIEKFQIKKSDGSSDPDYAYKEDELPRKDSKPGRDTIAESKTPYAQFKLKLPYGRYHIYAVANMGDMASYDDDIQTIGGLKQISLKWQDKDKVTENNQMFGHFTEKNVYSDDSYVLTINRKNMEVRAGLRRAVSKVTLAFDGSQLHEGVFVYIKSVQIKDIPQTCLLGNPNTPTTMEQLIEEGDTIRYDIQPYEDPNTGEIVTGPVTTYDEYYLARVTKGRPYFPHDDDYNKKFHSETERALYFYENMQGTGEDKRQKDEDGDGKPDNADRVKDAKLYGTYIEVQAYYRSIHQDKVGNGDIIYRFMLGKNVTTDYDAERNHHYKLTLCFKNFANDVDWHIDYTEPMPSIQVPEPYYISYLYNHNMMLPVKVNIPEGATLKSLEATIDTNSWAPYDVIYLQYRKDLDPYHGGPIRNWNGFLSLRKTTETVIKRKEEDKDLPDSTVNKNYYNTYRKGFREYKVTPGWHNDDVDPDGKEDGAYYVSAATKSSENGMSSTNFRIPMYTRAKQLISTTGYTGNNPYVAYQRKSVVKFVAKYEYNGEEFSIPQNADIRQVRRVVNPKGVWRKAGNTTPFHVVLKRLPRENDTQFETFTSEGKWKAYLIGSTDDFIDLGSDTVRGSTGSPIDFSIGFKPGGTYSADGNRCAIIRVEYHDYSCFHLIFVRQGDAPMAMEDKNGSKWHAYNMRTKDTEAESVAEEGSLFKFGNWEDPIDATNNVNDKIPWVNVEPGDFQGHVNTPFLIAGTKNTTKKWDEIASDPATSGAFEVTKLKNGKECRVADAGAYNELYMNEDIEFGYGVLYGDDAKETLSDISEVYGYRYTQYGKGYGMRGVFVYNASTKRGYRGRNMFFPLGVSGYGHRKEYKSNWAGTEVGTGVLRYAVRSNYYTSDFPLFYDIFMRPGAIYWLDKSSYIWRNGVQSKDPVVGWDINYFSFDFNYIEPSNIFNGAKSDACFIRCIDK